MSLCACHGQFQGVNKRSKNWRGHPSRRGARGLLASRTIELWLIRWCNWFVGLPDRQLIVPLLSVGISLFLKTNDPARSSITLQWSLVTTIITMLLWSSFKRRPLGVGVSMQTDVYFYTYSNQWILKSLSRPGKYLKAVFLGCFLVIFWNFLIFIYLL